MTEAAAALDALGSSESPLFDDALTRFYERWRDNPLVIDKWFALQAGGVGEQSPQRYLLCRRKFILRNFPRLQTAIHVRIEIETVLLHQT